MGELGAGVDVVTEREVPTPVDNRTPVVNSAPTHFTTVTMNKPDRV
jgi:hypothetical protein